jgi:hypothetical protein
MTLNASRLLETVDEMLLDAGQSHAGELRAALLSLGTLASLPAPVPGAELAALLAGPRDQLSRRRRLRRHRPAVVGLAVLAGMGMGVSGVAATASGQGQLSSPSVQHLLQDWVPAWNIAGGVLSASQAAGLWPDPLGEAQEGVAPAAGPAPEKAGSAPSGSAPSSSAPSGSAPSESAASESAHSKSAQSETAHSKSAQAGAEASEATGAEKARTDDAGAAAGQAAATPGLTAQGAKQGAAKAQADAARQPGKAQRQAAGTRAGKHDPAASWLKKFSR